MILFRAVVSFFSWNRAQFSNNICVLERLLLLLLLLLVFCRLFLVFEILQTWWRAFIRLTNEIYLKNAFRKKEHYALTGTLVLRSRNSINIHAFNLYDTRMSIWSNWSTFSTFWFSSRSFIDSMPFQCKQTMWPILQRQFIGNIAAIDSEFYLFFQFKQHFFIVNESSTWIYLSWSACSIKNLSQRVNKHIEFSKHNQNRKYNRVKLQVFFSRRIRCF